MKEKMNLWQRCEALGPMEDQGVSLYRTDSGDYRIFIDRATVFHVHQDGTIGDYCRAWLAEAILQRFEAITKQGGTVLTTSNVVKEVEWVSKEAVYSFSGGPKEWNERFKTPELPTPESLPEPTYIVESPKEFVSIPVGEYFDAKASIEQVKEAFDKLSEAFAAISKMYTTEP